MWAKLITESYTIKKLLQEVWAIITNVEKGLWYTVKQLFLNPDVVVKDYINGKTVPYYNPFRYLFIWVSFSLVLSLYFGTLQTAQQDINTIFIPNATESQREFIQNMQSRVNSYANLIHLLIIPFISFVSSRIFKKGGLNYAEHLIINAYFLAQNSIISIITILLVLLFPKFIHQYIYLSYITGILFFTYAYGKLFKLSIPNAFGRSLVIYLGGYLTLFATIFLLGSIVGYIIYLFSFL